MSCHTVVGVPIPEPRLTRSPGRRNCWGWWPRGTPTRRSPAA